MRICILSAIVLLGFLAPGALPAGDAALAVVEKIAGFVGFYTADGKRIGAAKIGAFPHEIVMSPDRRTLYVTDNGVLWMTDAGEGGNTISIVDTSSLKRTGVIDLGRYRRPHGIDIHPKSGLIAATTENPDGMVLVDPAKRKVIRFYDTQGGDSHMVVFDAAGEWAYVSNSATNTVAAIHLSTGKTQLIATGERPQGGVVSRDGKIVYFGNSTSNTISLIDTSAKKVAGVIRTSSGPSRLALTPDQKTMVYNLHPGDSVGVADVSARKEIGVVKVSGRAMSMTVSADGKLAYAGVQDQDKVFVISVPERRVVRVIDTPKGSGPDPALPLGR
jgi:YVTN family beta-propeller protein